MRIYEEESVVYLDVIMKKLLTDTTLIGLLGGKNIYPITTSDSDIKKKPVVIVDEVNSYDEVFYGGRVRKQLKSISVRILALDRYQRSKISNRVKYNLLELGLMQFPLGNDKTFSSEANYNFNDGTYREIKLYKGLVDVKYKK